MKSLKFSLHEKDYDRLKILKEQRKVSMADIIRDSITNWTGFDDGFLDMVREWSAFLKIPPHVFLENIAIAWLARRDAKGQAYQIKDVPLEAPFEGLDTIDPGDAICLTGQYLYDSLLAKYVLEEEDERAATLHEHQKRISAALKSGKLKQDYPLTAGDLAFLDRYEKERVVHLGKKCDVEMRWGKNAFPDELQAEKNAEKGK
jgi:hypothetical protein